MHMFKIITCMNNKNAIGKDNGLLYHIKSDMTNFKSMTIGNVVVMGRKTFESLPNKEPLKDRINIIMTTDENYCVDANDNVYITHSVDETVDLCESMFTDKEWFVIGGGSIYDAFLVKDLVDDIRVTLVDDDSDGDAFFPNVSFDDNWKVYYKSDMQTASINGNDVGYRFLVYKKK